MKYMIINMNNFYNIFTNHLFIICTKYQINREKEEEEEEEEVRNKNKARNTHKSNLYIFSLTFRTQFSMCPMLQIQAEIHSKRNHHQVYCEEDIVHEVCQCRGQEFPFSGKFFSDFFLMSSHHYLLLTYLIPDL